MFSLLGLLIAFTFSGAATRFDGRRHLIVEEANNIGTAYVIVDIEYPRLGMIRVDDADRVLMDLRESLK